MENERKKNTRFNTPTELFRRWLVVAFIVNLFEPSIKHWHNNSIGDVIVL
jgi:hypothetical protein